MKEFVNWLCCIMGGFFGFFFGGLDGVVVALLIFVVVDYITGVLSAIYNKKLSSAVGFKGILKKVVILIVVSIGHMVDYYLLGDASMIRDACIFFYISNEGISILENVIAMGVSVPKTLRAVLEQLNEEENDGDKDTD